MRERSALRELPVLAAVAVVLALVVKAFLVQAFFIPSGSMERTLHGCPGCRGDRVLVDKLVYDVRDVRRGEVVVFDGTGSFGPIAEASSRPGLLSRLTGAPSGTDYVKRVIGLPGDRVWCCSDGRVVVQPAGSAAAPLEEPYVFEDDHLVFCAAGTGEAACPPGAAPVVVPEGRLFVLGDHRSRSADSRAHLDDGRGGTVPVERVLGRAFAVVWPLHRAGLLD